MFLCKLDQKHHIKHHCTRRFQHVKCIEMIKLLLQVCVIGVGTVQFLCLLSNYICTLDVAIFTYLCRQYEGNWGHRFFYSWQEILLCLKKALKAFRWLNLSNVFIIWFSRMSFNLENTVWLLKMVLQFPIYFPFFGGTHAPIVVPMGFLCVFHGRFYRILTAQNNVEEGVP